MKQRNNYKYIFFDADDTLIDFDKDSQRAFLAAMKVMGTEEDAVLRTCIEFDYGNWDRIGLCDVHLPVVQERFHTLYLEHVRAIFEHVCTVHRLHGAEEAEKVFLEVFAWPGIELDGARETVAKLKGKYRVYAATNGITALQQGRLREFPLDGVFVSEEVGTIKPNPAFFAYALEKIGADPHECLMVGDSLSSDVAGARAAGIDCVWLNRRGKPRPENIELVAEIKSVKELLTIL